MSISSESVSGTPASPLPCPVYARELTGCFDWYERRRGYLPKETRESSPSTATTPTSGRKSPPPALDLKGCKLPEVHLSPPNARGMVQTPRGTVVESRIVPNGDKLKLEYDVPAGGAVLVFCERDAAVTVQAFNLARTAAHPVKVHLERDGPCVLRVLSRGLVLKLHRYEFLDLSYMGIDNETTGHMRAALLELLKVNPVMPA